MWIAPMLFGGTIPLTHGFQVLMYPIAFDCGGAKYAREQGIPVILFPKAKNSSESLSEEDLVGALSCTYVKNSCLPQLHYQIYFCHLLFGGPGENKVNRQMSESSIYTTHQDKDDDDANNKIELGPLCTLKEQFEKDKDDESLRRRKEQVLDINAVGESLDPEVKILSLIIKSPGRSAIVLPIPKDGNPKSPWFVLKEGSKYSLKFTFQVSNNIATCLKYMNTVWKTGIKVDSTKQMIGAFSPQLEPLYTQMPEHTTPSGIVARGSYSARTKVIFFPFSL
ncbi:rho GDP-dissociation inhibitor 1-like [Lycium barbarum]|uniref:rho GDP-dissociation inhibitor 1-like n=1 Tax=Lycium barbarum TaxID=112863 RepID=UPI00293ECD6E|nr:rho GDP-dissociation inhibitor 1-like [Lycium barbarum]